MRIEPNDDQAIGAPQAGAGGVRMLLRAEGLAVFALSLALYAQTDAGWLLFILLFFAPDLSFLGYLVGSRVGAALYNAAHSYVGPAVLAAAGMLGGPPDLLAWALIWAAHIGLDRAMGYGLKYARGFSFTHLGRIGRATAA
ncbi:DUF4260 domain-containing protein [Caulobacter sp. 73W]|uniref:DUF4260 domain-containing protein n=1 Tax=Caulobacter sp. 73W TaxID=3161137 RepID=A0AB39KXD9_9CAUL